MPAPESVTCMVRSCSWEGDNLVDATALHGNNRQELTLAVTVTTPPGGVNFNALDSKLRIT